MICLAHPEQNNILARNKVMPLFSNTKNVVGLVFVFPAVLVTLTALLPPLHSLLTHSLTPYSLTHSLVTNVITLFL